LTDTFVFIENDAVNIRVQVFTVVFVHMMSLSFVHHFSWVYYLHLQGDWTGSYGLC